MTKSSKTPNEQFASRVRSLRAERSIAQSALAKATGVSAAAIWQWEHAGAVPRRPTLAKLATALGVSVAFLLTGNSEGIADLISASVVNPTSISACSLEELIRAIEARGFQVRLESL